MAASKLACAALMIAACAPPEAEQTIAANDKALHAGDPTRPGRHAESLAKLRKDAQIVLPAKLPTKGISYGHGGTELDLDVDAGTATYVGQDGPRTVPLAPADVSRLWAEAEDVWRDPKPKAGADAVAPTDFLAIVDHDDAYYLHAGPGLPSSSAKKLIDELAKVVPPVRPDPAPQTP